MPGRTSVKNKKSKKNETLSLLLSAKMSRHPLFLEDDAQRNARKLQEYKQMLEVLARQRREQDYVGYSLYFDGGKEGNEDEQTEREVEELVGMLFNLTHLLVNKRLLYAEDVAALEPEEENIGKNELYMYIRNLTRLLLDEELIEGSQQEIKALQEEGEEKYTGTTGELHTLIMNLILRLKANGKITQKEVEEIEVPSEEWKQEQITQYW